MQLQAELLIDVYQNQIGILALKGRTENSTEGFPQWKRCSIRSAPDSLQQEVSLCTAWHRGLPQGGDACLVLPVAPTGSLDQLPTGLQWMKRNFPQSNTNIKHDKCSSDPLFFCFMTYSTSASHPYAYMQVDISNRANSLAHGAQISDQ